MASQATRHASENVPEPDLTKSYDSNFSAPNLPLPQFYIFRGFIPESYNISETGIDNVSVPARLLASGGIVRAVDARLMGMQTCINLRPANTKEGEISGAINGLIQAFHLTDGQTTQQWINSHPAGSIQFARRSIACFESISWLALPATTHIFVQIMDPIRTVPASLDYPLLQTYVDQQLARARNVDTEGDFAREFIGTTRGWPMYWLNDRETARRPWVHIERSSITSGSNQLKFNDNILIEHPPSPHNSMSHRYLPSEYSALTYQCKNGYIPTNPTNIQGEDWTGHRLVDSNTRHYMFGFGSLINTKSRTSSDPSAIAAIPVRISADVGYSRCWNFQHPMAHLTALGVKAAETKGDKGCTINGVCTPIKGAGNGESAFLPQEVLDREVGYTPISIESSMCHCLGWQKLPEGSKVWLFVPNGPEGYEPGHGLQEASWSHPILQTYVDICVLGCLEHSKEFAIEFITSTVGWNAPWLNDRKVARRPWVHQPKYMVVDNLLKEAIPEQFKNRLLPTDYGASQLEMRFKKDEETKTSSTTNSLDGEPKRPQRLESFSTNHEASY